jgi:tripartite-type tricarboxylate transporter receptor subunit TctC
MDHNDAPLRRAAGMMRAAVALCCSLPHTGREKKGCDMIRNSLAALLALGIAVAASDQAAAQSYPSRPIKLIVPFPPGGPIDVMARLVSQKLNATFGTVIVENRPGGGSTIGLKAVATAEPDGYTFLFGGTMTLSVIPPLFRGAEAEQIKAMVPVTLVSATPFVLIVAPRVPAKTVPEFVAYAKANPGKLNFGAPAGATPLLVGELFKMKAGVDITTIPYRGAANTMTDMITGQIDMALEPTSVTLAHIHEGKIRALAVTSRARSPELPDLPTMGESGVPGVVAVSWTGVSGPAKTPPDVVATLNRAINDALKSPDMAAALRRLGSDPLGGTAQDFSALLAEEGPKWVEVVKSSGIKID